MVTDALVLPISRIAFIRSMVWIVARSVSSSVGLSAISRMDRGLPPNILSRRFTISAESFGKHWTRSASISSALHCGMTSRMFAMQRVHFLSIDESQMAPIELTRMMAARLDSVRRQTGVWEWNIQKDRTIPALFFISFLHPHVSAARMSAVARLPIYVLPEVYTNTVSDVGIA